MQLTGFFLLTLFSIATWISGETRLGACHSKFLHPQSELSYTYYNWPTRSDDSKEKTEETVIHCTIFQLSIVQI